MDKNTARYLISEALVDRDVFSKSLNPGINRNTLADQIINKLFPKPDKQKLPEKIDNSNEPDDIFEEVAIVNNKLNDLLDYLKAREQSHA